MRMFRSLVLMVALAVGSGADAWSREFQGFVACQGPGWAALRSQQEYKSFVERVPRERLQKKLPAPPSSDPLLQLPGVDFSTSCLVVVWSDNVHIEARVLQAEAKGEELWVEVRFHRPPHVEGYAAPYGFGQYHLVEVPRFEGALQVKESEVLEQP